MIAIVDYGLSNLQSVANAFRRIGCAAEIVKSPDHLESAQGIVLPGVGAFGDGIRNLRATGFVDALNDLVLEQRRPFLGICLGLQFIAEESFEHGCHRGLGWIRGAVRRINPSESHFKVPHMGWNSITLTRPSILFDGLGDAPAFYFVHSYHVEVPADDGCHLTSTCWHGSALTASVECGHIFGVQFHPEKSQEAGIRLLTNFVRFAGAQC